MDAGSVDDAVCPPGTMDQWIDHCELVEREDVVDADSHAL